MDGPPPPPPPHGENPRSSGLPPGKFDIFIIPEHSSGGGFLYLPSLKPNINSFVAGFASALLLVLVGNALSPAILMWWNQIKGAGGAGMFLFVMAIALLAWTIGRVQMDGGGGPGGGGNTNSHGWQSPPSSGPSANGHAGPQPSYGTGPPPGTGPMPGAGAPPPNPGAGQRSQWQQRPPPGSTHASGDNPGPNPSTAGADTAGASARSAWEKAREETKRKEEERKTREAEAKRKADLEARLREAREAREKDAREREAREKKKRDDAAAAAAAAEDAKRREEARLADMKRREEERLADMKRREEERLAEIKRREEAHLADIKRREDEARRQEEEAREKRRKEEEALEKKRQDIEAMEQRLKDAREKAAKEQAVRDLRARYEAAKEKTRKDLEEKKKKDEALRESIRKDSEARAAKRAEEESKPRGSMYAFSAVGEKTNPWPQGRPATPPRTAPVSPPKKPPPPTAKAHKGNEDETHSYRPYDKAKKPMHKKSLSSLYSESSYAASQSTSRTTPPPSRREPYSTKDPSKIVIKAVYAYLPGSYKLPASQLVSGTGAVTDGLVLRIETEGLFIDDDVRGVGQREWDAKAWGLKLIEVWCPSFRQGSATSIPSASARASPTLSNLSSASTKTKQNAIRRLWGLDKEKPASAEELDTLVAEMIHLCSTHCRFSPHHTATPLFTSSPLSNNGQKANKKVNFQTGEVKSKKLHVLRVTVRDPDGKRYVFVVDDSESWKLALGIQKLRKSSLVRNLGVSGMSTGDSRSTLENLGWG
jgi:hypothetical protein